LQTNGATPLFIACQQGHADVVTTLLDRGASHAQAKVLHRERAQYQ
jgi:ankyrin repeat protein